MDSSSNVTRNGELHIIIKESQEYCKLQNHLQEKVTRDHTFAMEKTDLRVVLGGVPMSSDFEETFNDLCAKGIVVTSLHNMYSSKAPIKELPLMLAMVRRGQDKTYKITRCLELIIRVEKQRVI